MSLAVSRLRGWSPELLTAAAADLRATADLLLELQRGVNRAVGEMRWESPGADAARTAAESLVLALAALEQSFSLQGDAVTRVGAMLEAAQELLVRSSRLADDHGLTMLEDGGVLPPRPVLMSADAPYAEKQRVADAFAAADEARRRAEAGAREALRSATEADRDAAAAIRAGDALGLLLAGIAPGIAGLLTSTSPLEAYALAERTRLLDAVDGRQVPDRGSDPYDVSAWWATLPPEVQQGVLVTAPELLGSLDGIPAGIRDAANRARLDAERALLAAEVVRLEKRLRDNWFGGAFTDDDAALVYARGKLEGMDELAGVLDKDDRMLLLLDTGGEQLEVAVAVGDVDTADHVAVFTGGLGSTVQESLTRYDGQLHSLRDQAVEMAQRAGSGSVAAVTWLGYEAPQPGDIWRPSRSVALPVAASRGAQDLAAFYTGLDAARESSSHLVALGHSYGSLTTGIALQQGTGVDDVVFLGSPGIGTDDVRNLGLRAGHVFVIEARRDPVADLAAFGADPNQLAGVTVLSAAREIIDNEARAESLGHSQYLTQETSSQYGIAAVVAGVPERAPLDGGSGGGDVARRLIPFIAPASGAVP
ncbi:MAG: alpha/beta hydrolase [Mycobacteriales bacterium]